MASFERTVIIIAGVLLVIALFMVAKAIKKTSTKNWPPVVGECPDFWVDLSGNGEKCLNAHSIGKCNLPTTMDKNTMNFNVAPFNSDSGDCSKYNWAVACGTEWGGITYAVDPLPCASTTDDSE